MRPRTQGQPRAGSLSPVCLAWEAMAMSLVTGVTVLRGGTNTFSTSGALTTWQARSRYHLHSLRPFLGPGDSRAVEGARAGASSVHNSPAGQHQGPAQQCDTASEGLQGSSTLISMTGSSHGVILNNGWVQPLPKFLHLRCWASAPTCQVHSAGRPAFTKEIINTMTN